MPRLPFGCPANIGCTCALGLQTVDISLPLIIASLTLPLFWAFCLLLVFLLEEEDLTQ